MIQLMLAIWSLVPLPFLNQSLTIVLQALWLSDLIPWIYLSLPLYNRKGFEWSCGFPTFFNLSLNLAIRSPWPEPQSALSPVFADCIELLHLWLQRIYQSDFGIDHLVISMCRVFSYVVGKGCLLWPVCSLGRTLLAFDLLRFVLQGQICLLLQISLDFLLLHSSPL